MYEVIVGNLGTVLQTTNKFNAMVAYNTYLGRSKRREGRGAGEPITLLGWGDVLKEYYPPEE